MSSQVHNALARSLAARTAFGGEVVTFNGTDYTVPPVNWIGATNEPGGPVDIATKERFAFELPLSVTVRNGDTFEHENGATLTVQKVSHRGYGVILIEGEVHR